MKPIALIRLLAGLLFISFNGSAQDTKEKPATTKPGGKMEQHIALEKFPKNMVINHLDGWGGMTIAVNELPAGTDFTPLLKGLKNNSCQVPHWGYILKGAMRLKYDDGTEVLLKAGDAFYMAPGHKGSVEEDLKLIDFSPEKEMNELIKHIEQKIAKPGQ
ncbi:MAG TPA: cupin domain-containing protein [Chitinophagaceae bacterium]|nr:cupin domain-containing protein [Chitinophagaceae bacterium]